VCLVAIIIGITVFALKVDLLVKKLKIKTLHETLNVLPPKPLSFISTNLESNVFSVFFYNFRKTLTIKNVILGFFVLIVMVFVKRLGIPMYVLDFFGLENTESEFLQNIIVGIIGLVSRLGSRGLIEGIFASYNYATMGGDGNALDCDPGESSTPGKGGTPTPEVKETQGDISSEGDKQGKSSSESNKQGESSSIDNSD
jgi:hypothetical protein